LRERKEDNCRGCS